MPVNIAQPLPVQVNVPFLNQLVNIYHHLHTAPAMVHPTGPSHVWKELGLPSTISIPWEQALHTLPRSIVGGFYAGATPAPKPIAKNYAIINDVMCMGEKVLITNLTARRWMGNMSPTYVRTKYHFS